MTGGEGDGGKVESWMRSWKREEFNYMAGKRVNDKSKEQVGNNLILMNQNS